VDYKRKTNNIKEERSLMDSTRQLLEQQEGKDVLPVYVYICLAESNAPAKIIAYGRCSTALSPVHHG
jgi:hypothetical protein